MFDLSKTLKAFSNFILRHLVWVLLVSAGIAFLWIYFGSFFWQFVATLLMCVIAEGIAIALSGMALYAYTNNRFTRSQIYGADQKLGAYEQHGLMIATGFIFFGVHFVVGIVSAGVYFAQFN